MIYNKTTILLNSEEDKKYFDKLSDELLEFLNNKINNREADIVITLASLGCIATHFFHNIEKIAGISVKEKLMKDYIETLMRG